SSKSSGAVLKRSTFVVDHLCVISNLPLRLSTPPRGEQWLHEVKFDGWRIQLHKNGSSAEKSPGLLRAPRHCTWTRSLSNPIGRTVSKPPLSNIHAAGPATATPTATTNSCTTIMARPLWPQIRIRQREIPFVYLPSFACRAECFPDQVEI